MTALGESHGPLPLWLGFCPVFLATVAIVVLALRRLKKLRGR